MTGPNDQDTPFAAEDESWLGGEAKSLFYVLSGPGGTGKSTLIQRWRQADPTLGYVKNYTTRARRAPDPKSGIDDTDWYEFVDVIQFRKLVEEDFFVQWSHAAKGYLSGTPLPPLRDAIAEGRDLVFDYTPQLYLNLRRMFPENTVGILTVPPSLKILAERLRVRGSELDQRFRMKFEMGRQDLAYHREHDYIVTNDDLDESLELLKGIRLAEKARLANRTGLGETFERLTPQPRPMLFYYDPFGDRISEIDADPDGDES